MPNVETEQAAPKKPISASSMPNTETEQAVPKKPISVSKMDIEELKDYTERMAQFASGDGVIAIRICECCVKIAS